MDSEPQLQRFDEDPHSVFRNLCMAFGDANRAVFLEEILNFIEGFGASPAELAAIRTAVRKRAKQLAKRGKRGRPRAQENEAWLQKAAAAAFRKRVLGWSWSRVTESMGLKPTKPNIRTVQRRELQFAEFIADAIPPEWWEPAIAAGQYGRKLREGALDSQKLRLWLWSRTGLRFDKRPEDCKKLLEVLLSPRLPPAPEGLARRSHLSARNRGK